MSGGCYGVCDIKPLLPSSIKFSGKSQVLPDTWTHTDSLKGLSGERWSRSQKPGRQLTLACTHWAPGIVRGTWSTSPPTQPSLPPYGVNATEAEIETPSGYTYGNHQWWFLQNSSPSLSLFNTPYNWWPQINVLSLFLWHFSENEWECGLQRQIVRLPQTFALQLRAPLLCGTTLQITPLLGGQLFGLDVPVVILRMSYAPSSGNHIHQPAPRNRKHFITQINSSPLFHRR